MDARRCKAERFFAQLYQDPPQPLPLSAEDHQRICEVLLALSAPLKPPQDSPRVATSKSNTNKTKALRISAVVRSMGYPPADNATLVLIAARLERILKRVRGERGARPAKSKCFCLGLGKERVYTEEDRPLIREAVLGVLGSV